ncbi:840_t:CDS:2 [Paraglomus occultum]|uniref:840_t:CDS:1 n=1 Tax=Paraglomus occultum TaxID=144539 RepID=A0A9N9BIB4_9GLOM|nr:840_t:CDS:2 [Paraglomus occultum]
MSNAQHSLASLNHILPKPLTFITLAATLSLVTNIVNRKQSSKLTSQVESALQSLQIVQTLRSDPSYVELNRGYSMFSDEAKKSHLTAGSLSGNGKVAIEPLVFRRKEGFGNEAGEEVVAIYHLGKNLCGHQGIIHGGMLATVMDECLAFTTIPNLPDKNAATAYLHINYRQPCVSDQFVVVKCTVTKVEGRKGFVEGKMETVDGKTIVDANALFISIKILKNDK